MTPSPSQRAAVVVAHATIATVAELRDRPIGKELAHLVIETAARHAGAVKLTSLDRRLPVYAASWANYHLTWMTRPGEVTTLRPGGSPLARTVAAVQRQMTAMWPGADDVGHPLDVRLLVHRDGLVLIDQITSEHAANAVGADRFARAACAAHFAFGGTLGGFAGVRLLAPRIPLASRHYVTPDAWHLVGACPTCGLRIRTGR